MTTEAIENIIDQINDGQKSDAFIGKISETVDFGIVWVSHLQFHLFLGEYQMEAGYAFYFIKRDAGQYVGAVHVMTSEKQDLHWFMKKEFRKKGLLTNALKDYILPHLLEKKNGQRITIDVDQIGETNYYNSKKVAMAVGFEEKSEREFWLSKSKITSNKTIELIKQEITKERIDELGRNLRKAATEIKKIEDEFKIKIGELNGLKNLREKIEEYGTYKLEDEYWNLNNKINR